MSRNYEFGAALGKVLGVHHKGEGGTRKVGGQSVGGKVHRDGLAFEWSTIPASLDTRKTMINIGREGEGRK